MKMNYKYILNKANLLLAVVFLGLMPSTFGAGFTNIVSEKGAYDIKMISSTGLQPVWVKYGASNMDVVRPLTKEEQMMAGRTLMHNNDLVGVAGKQISTTGVLNIAPFESLSSDGKKAQVGLAYTDCDTDPTTFQSSSAYLDFGKVMGCSVIKKAYLYWVGTDGATTVYPSTSYKSTTNTMQSYPGGAVGNVANHTEVWLKAQGESDYEVVSPANGYAVREIATTDFGDHYVCMADVTDYMLGKTGGLYTVANIKSSSDHGNSPISGWSLIVLYTPPNCPNRIIKIWDGYGPVGGSGGPSSLPINFSFAPNERPESDNNISYFGVAALDAEAYATELMLGNGTDWNPFTQQQMKDLTIDFQSFPGGVVKEINPFANKIYSAKNKKGTNIFDDTDSPYYGLATDNLIDGVLCSRLSTWDEDKDDNGIDIRRLPDLTYTAGYDAHHIKLPNGSFVNNATSARVTMYCERGGDCGGGYTAFMAYMAIQTAEPDLQLQIKADEAEVATSGTINYDMTVKNIGPLESAAGAYILDTLDKKVNFVAGSAKYYDKTGAEISSVTLDYVNTGSDEVLKFTLPLIAAANGSNIDSITIKYQVQVEPSSNNSGIWAYGCNLLVRNKASINFFSSDNSLLTVGSNSSASCDGVGAYYTTPINDAVLIANYEKYQNQVLDLSAQVNGGSVPIVSTLLTKLAAVLVEKGLPASEAMQYKVYTSSGDEVSSTSIFTDVEPIQNYYAKATFGCEEIYNFEVSVIQTPKINEATSQLITPPSCPTSKDAVYKFSFINGEAPYVLTVVGLNNDTLSRVYSDGSDVLLDGFAAGDYTVTVADAGTQSSTTSLSIPSGVDLSVSLPDDMIVCVGDAINISATASTSGLNYVWKSATQNSAGVWGAYSVISATTTEVLPTTTATQTTKYKVYACNGACQAIDSVVVTVNAIPVPKLHSDTTVSITINPSVTLWAQAGSPNGPYVFDWEASIDGGSTWQAISSSLLGTHSFVNDSVLTIADIAGAELAMDGYKYRVAVSAGGCAAATKPEVMLTVVKGPAVSQINKELAWESCPGNADGQLSFTVSAGEPGQTYDIALYTGSGYSGTNLPTAAAIKTVSFTGGTPLTFSTTATLPASDYSMILTPVGGLPGLETYYTKAFYVSSPEPLAAVISAPTALCKGDALIVNVVSVSGGKPEGVKEWYFEGIEEGGPLVNLTGLPSQPYSYLNPDFQKNTAYTIKVTDDGNCETPSNTVTVSALETPVAAIYSSGERDRSYPGCYKYDLHNLPVYNKDASGSTEYDVTMHRAYPEGPQDNTTIIAESDYGIKKNMTVFARLSLGGICSDVVSAKIMIKKMEECYPISIQEFFSPDGDGINDLFQMPGLENYDRPEIKIYDRFGKMVFKGAKEDLLPPNGWDGKYLGKELPSADYWYEMTFTEIKTKVGHFTLKRKKE